MKKLYILGLFAFGTVVANAQSVEIITAGTTTDISGTTITIEGGESLHETFDVKNVSGGDLTLRIERVKISEISGATDYICWGANSTTGTCYPSSSVAPYDPFVTPDEAVISNGSVGWLQVYYNANGTPGTSLYRYYVVDDADVRLDSIDVENISTVGVEDELENLSVSVYPNPATDVVNIKMNNNVNNVSVIIYNILGEAVATKNLIAGVNTINTSEFNSGVYFYAIRHNNEVIETKKLVIK